MKVIVKTKSNYGELNGKELDVVEIAGTRVSVKVFSTEFCKDVIVDFGLSEVEKFVGSAEFAVEIGEFSKLRPSHPVRETA